MAYGPLLQGPLTPQVLQPMLLLTPRLMDLQKMIITADLLPASMRFVLRQRSWRVPDSAPAAGILTLAKN